MQISLDLLESETRLIQYLNVSTLEGRMAVEMGVRETTEWLEWLNYTAQHNRPVKSVWCVLLQDQIWVQFPFPL